MKSLIINPCGGPSGPVFCRIKFTDDGRLSITGVEGPKPYGECRGSCGQIDTTLKGYPAERLAFNEGWTAELFARFLEIWDRWHLNDMRAGSPAQEDWLRTNPFRPIDYALGRSHYEIACEKLAAAGLNSDPSNGYSYGSAWNKEEVPPDVLAFLFALPPSKIAPAWV